VGPDPDQPRREVLGDDEPFRLFVATRMGSLLSFAHLLTGDRSAAEDLVQTALARTAIAWWRVRNRDDPEGYVRRAILRTQQNAWRRGVRELPMAEPPEPEPGLYARPDPGREIDDRDLLWRALRLLPPRQRAVLVLRYYEDRSETEIAQLLGCRPGTVKSQAAKALARLRRELSDPAEVQA
jgi:RNA polymerase sigma-70 factor (sigma-E family)